jgi:hypothetical protein
VFDTAALKTSARVTPQDSHMHASTIVPFTKQENLVKPLKPEDRERNWGGGGHQATVRSSA